ncbi:hypothetical protein D3C73_1637320 [compost metagenome]
MARRYQIYNEVLDRAEELERNGEAVIIRPTAAMDVGRMTKDQGKLTALYEIGYRDAEAQLERVKSLLS